MDPVHLEDKTPDEEPQEDATASALEALHASRANRKAKLHKSSEAQRLIDLTAIDALEEEHGDSNVSYIEIKHVPGLPILAACKCPSPVIVKKYRSDVKERKGRQADHVKAAEDVGHVCLIYPDQEVFAEMCAARAGIKVALGVKALKLSNDVETEDLKS